MNTNKAILEINAEIKANLDYIALRIAENIDLDKLALKVAEKTQMRKEFLSREAASLEFGRNYVTRWIECGLLVSLERVGKTGKQRIVYRRKDLEELANREQDLPIIPKHRIRTKRKAQA